MRRLLALVFGMALLAALVLPASADIPLVSYKSTYTGSGTRTGPGIVLAGQNTCTVTTSGGASGYTVTVKGSSVGSGTLTTLTQFGSSGAITTDSSNVGALVGTQVALTNFTYVVTGTITGTLTVVETCSSASAGATVTGTVNVSVSNFPSPGPSSSPGGVPLVVLANASAVPYSVTSPQPVTTPAPAYKNSSGSTQAVLCDKTFLTSTAITSATTTLLLDAVAGKQYFICLIQVISTGTNTGASVFPEYGTKTTTDCDTGATAINAPIGTNLAATATLSLFGITSTAVPLQPASTQLCVVTSGTVNFKVFILYALI